MNDIFKALFISTVITIITSNLLDLVSQGACNQTTIDLPIANLIHSNQTSIISTPSEILQDLEFSTKDNKSGFLNIQANNLLSLSISQIPSEYELQEILFLSPTKHTLEGFNFSLELWLVHKPLNPKNRQVIFSLFLSDKRDKHNKLLDSFNTENSIIRSLNTSLLYRKNESFYFYYTSDGSNCTDDSIFLVFPNEISISRAQMNTILAINSKSLEIPMKSIEKNEVYFNTNSSKDYLSVFLLDIIKTQSMKSSFLMIGYAFLIAALI